MTPAPSHLHVLHSCKTWLPATQRWLYTQLNALPEDVTPHIACRQTDNLDAFGRPNLYVFDDQTRGIPGVDWAFEQLRCASTLDALGENPVDALDRGRWVDYRADLAARLGADVLHSHFGHIGWRDLGVARRAGLKHVVMVYGWDVSLLPRQQPEWRDRYRQLFAEVDAVLCEGPHMGEVVGELGCPADKIRVHHLGVDLEDTPFRPRRFEADAPIRVLMAASFKEKKGLPFALEALGRLEVERDLAITIIGDSVDEERSRREEEKIEVVIERHDLQARIRRLGFVSYDRLLTEMLEHDIFLSPSVTSERGDSEGGAPVTIIAAQATGMPVVATDHADIPNVVVDGRTGLLAPERDPDTLAEHLATLITSPSMGEEFSRAAREHVVGAFDARHQGRRLAALYQALVSTP